ncbi:MAG: TIR domain-containing protein [bacterium]
MSSAKTQKTEIPRIFISHAWEDKALVRRLEKVLTDAGAEVWVDHAGIRGGDNLPERINDALEWCNTLLLVWSKPAKASHWVKLEWTNAISLRKLIIPCPIDGTPAPPIMANTAYVDFSDEKKGVRELLQALRLAQIGETDSALANVIHSRLMQAEPAAVPKPPQDAPKAAPPKSKPPVSKPTPPARPTIIHLRYMPINPLPVEAVQQMLREKNFYAIDWNPSGKGITHKYESVERHGAALVIDHATGLTWQKSGSENYMPFEDAKAYVQQLNAKKFGGCNDWRLPTLEEAMSLMEPKKHGDLYLDLIFDCEQRWIWTADKESAWRAWCVGFFSGGCGRHGIGDDIYVRAVRSGQSII